MRTVSRCLAVWLIAVVSLLGATACSSPSAQATACSGRAQISTAVDGLRQFDYTNGNATSLAALLKQLQDGLKKVESAVHLPQDSRLNDLGGVTYLRQLQSKIGQVVSTLDTSVANRRPVDLSSLENEVTLRRGQAEQVAGSVTGC